eukprot:3684915-Pleurochrysis_carterae.AAC.3
MYFDLTSLSSPSQSRSQSDVNPPEDGPTHLEFPPDQKPESQRAGLREAAALRPPITFVLSLAVRARVSQRPLLRLARARARVEGAVAALQPAHRPLPQAARPERQGHPRRAAHARRRSNVAAAAAGEERRGATGPDPPPSPQNMS